MDVLKPTPLVHPFTEDQVRGLQVGEKVLVTGCVFTGRDRLHRYLHDGGNLPVSLENGAIYHCGPVMQRMENGWTVKAAGPTTSIREEPYMARIIAHHKVRVILGKGGMGARTVAACARYGCVYLQTIGGAAQVLARCIREVAGVHFLREFGEAEAMWELRVESFPAVVAITAAGESLYTGIEEHARRELTRLFKHKEPVNP